MVCAIDKDGYRAIVEEAHFHVVAEAAASNGDAESFEGATVGEDDRLGDIGWGGGTEARAASAAGVSVEGELANDEGFAANIEQREIEAPFRVAKDSKLGGLRRETYSFGFVVTFADTDEDEQPGPDFADDLAIDTHGGVRHPLDDELHIEVSVVRLVVAGGGSRGSWCAVSLGRRGRVA